MDAYDWGGWLWLLRGDYWLVVFILRVFNGRLLTGYWVGSWGCLLADYWLVIWVGHRGVHWPIIGWLVIWAGYWGVYWPIIGWCLLADY